MSIRIRGLTKVFRGGIHGLTEVDLDIGPDGMFGLLGRNGAGKTTLLRILTTLIEPTCGDVTVSGLDLRDNKREIRRMIGYLPQNFGVYPELSAYEFLDYMGLLYEMDDSRKRRSAVTRCLDMVGLAEVGNRKLGTFSGGMIRRMGIAQAFLNSPRILIVDEPTADLDPEERVNFRNILSEGCAGMTVIMSTHNVGDVSSTCSRLAILDRSRVVFDGRPDQLLRAAAGRIFEIQLGEGPLDEAKRKHVVISSIREEAGWTLRVVGEPDLPGGTPVVPTLEDAYIAKMAEV